MPRADLGGREGLGWALGAVERRLKTYELYRNYYDGEHRLLFATNRFKATFGDLFSEFADNLCPVVVDALVNRLQLTGWATVGDDPAGDLATAAWEENLMALRSGEVHLDAARCGDAFLLVWPGADTRARMWPQEPTAMAVQYDDEDDPSAIMRAGKVWHSIDGRWRANVYTGGLIERWVTSERKDDRPDKPGQFVPFEADDAGPEVQHSWGVPVFHFGNGAPIGAYGRSELAGVVPLQDALNKSVADMLVAAEFIALPQRVAIGLEREYDPNTGDERKTEPGADRLWIIRNPAATVTQFPAADLRWFLSEQESFRLEIARVTGTPAHELMLNSSGSGGFSTAPSGEALDVLDGRLVKKAKARLGGWGPVWRKAQTLALTMNGTPPAARLVPLWDDPGTDSPLTQVQVIQGKIACGLSKRQGLRELGYTDEQLDAIEAERTEEAGSLGDAMLAAFDRGAPAAIGG